MKYQLTNFLSCVNYIEVTPSITAKCFYYFRNFVLFATCFGQLANFR
jgi:hypothetical protein